MAIHFGISMDNHLVQPGHLDLLVLIRKLLGLADHLLDLFFRQAALVVGDGDLLLRLRSGGPGGDVFFDPKASKDPQWESAWWYTYPSEKYEFVSWGDYSIYSQYMESHKSHVPVTTTQQSMGISWNSGPIELMNTP